MNKIKLVSDIMKTMKNKEEVKGSITVNGLAPKTSFNFTKEFDGDEIKSHHKHLGHGHGHGHFMKMKKMHMTHGGHEGFDSRKEMEDDGHGFTWRDKLSMMSTGLDVFNSIKVEELDAGKISLSLSKDDLSEELITKIKEGIHKKHGGMGHHGMGGHEEFAKELHDMSNPVFYINVIVNEAKEVQELSLKVSGQGKDGKCEANVELQLE